MIKNNKGKYKIITISMNHSEKKPIYVMLQYFLDT